MTADGVPPMVERVADAIKKFAPTVPNPVLRDIARAAIEAMREPTEGMLRAAHEAVRYEESLSGGWMEWSGSNRKRHAAMIEAALSHVPAPVKR